MSHPFGDLISQYLHRKHGLSQAKLAAGILQDPTIIGKMCKGQRLSGPQARERVVAIIHWLHEQAVLITLIEAYALLNAAEMVGLREHDPNEVELIKKLNAGISQSATPSLSQPALRTNLPAQLTSFIGREQEMAEIKRLIKAHRLVTLTGAGGVGKTRLAIETGMQLLKQVGSADQPDEVWLVEVAALADAALIPQAITQAIGLVVPAGRMHLDLLLDYLRDKRLLLIVDNCEHLIEACAQVNERVLQHCWQVRVLATSREALRVPGEMSFIVPSLEIPQSSENSPSQLMECTSVRLFVERVRTSQPLFTVQPVHIAPLTQICQHLGGIPLALELAAPLSETMALDEMAGQLAHQLSLLVNSSRTTTPRHRTMHHALDWSYKLLVPAEQHLLTRLSIFAGGWTVEAATAICANVEETGSSKPHQGDRNDRTDSFLDEIYPLPAAKIPALIRQLVRKSLVVAETRDEEIRYRLLEPIRQFAQDQWDSPEHANELKRRHATYFLWLAEQTEAVRDTFDEQLWLPRLERERDNLRVALQWAIDSGEAEFAQRLNVALFSFWLYCSGMSEVNHWITAILELASSARTPLSITFEAKSLTIAGYAAVLIGDVVGAQQYFERSLALFMEVDDPRGIATSLRNLGYTAMIRDDLTPAHQYAERSLLLCRETQDPWGLAWSCYDVGYAALAQGELNEAKPLLDEAIIRFTQEGNQFGSYRAFLGLGHVMCGQGHFANAKDYYNRAFAIQQQLHYIHSAADGLEGLASIAVAFGQSARAARLLAAAQAHRDFASTPRWPFLQRTYDRDLAIAKAQLTKANWALAWDEGKVMTLEQSIQYALDD